MSDRWVTFWGALGALFVVVILLFAPQAPVTVSRPTTVDGGPNGYLGLKRWLQRNAVDVRSVRQRLHKAAVFSHLPTSGNVLITTMPYRNTLRTEEQRALRRWVRQGNTLLLLAALDDSPKWISGLGSHDMLEDLQALTGITFSIVKRREGDEPDFNAVFETPPLQLPVLQEHPVMRGVEHLRGVSDAHASRWQASLEESTDFYLRLAYEQEYGVDALWQIPTGRGQIFLSASGSLLTNRILGDADNARFFSNLLSLQLAPGGVVVIDDFHQGLSDIYDPEAFFGDARFHRSLLFLIAFWLIYLVGSSARLAPLRETVVNSQQTALVRATGVLMARKLSTAEAGRAMIDNWLLALRHAGYLPGWQGASPPWQKLAQMPLTDPEVLAAIRDAHARLGRGEKVDLGQLHNNIQRMKKDMA